VFSDIFVLCVGDEAAPVGKAMKILIDFILNKEPLILFTLSKESH
jgi:hypothetical protein